MIDIRISLPIAMNAVCSISFEDSEGSYILTAPNAGETLLEQIGMLMEGNHPNKKLQQTYSFLGLRAVELDVLESMIPVDDLARKGQQYINECSNCFNTERRSEVLPSQEDVVDVDYFNNTESNYEYEGEINKVVKVYKNSDKTVKDRSDIIDTYTTMKSACINNPSLTIADVRRQLNEGITYYTNLPYYFCFDYNLNKKEPKLIHNNKPTYQITG